MELLRGIQILDTIAAWINEHAVAIVIILIGAALVKRLGMMSLEGVIRRAVKTSRFQSEAEHKQREETLLDISHSVFGLIVWLIAVVLLFMQLEVNLQPFLAAGGIMGIIIGFGAQNIMRDLFAGIYVITENQYQIGDVVSLDDDIGTVEDITLRAASLRDLDGTVHHIPHGNVSRTKNLSKNYARINLDVGISYDSDINHVIEVVNKVGKELANDEDWRDIIITPPKFWRIEHFGDSSIDIKMVGETKPLMQWAASGELRKRLKAAFDEENIEIPFPQRVIHSHDAKAESKDKNKDKS